MTRVWETKLDPLLRDMGMRGMERGGRFQALSKETPPSLSSLPTGDACGRSRLLMGILHAWSLARNGFVVVVLNHHVMA